MSFLSWIADWCEENIPLVGSYIADLVEKIEKNIESWSWIWRYYSEKVWNWYLDVYQTVNDFVSDPADFISRHLPSWISDSFSDVWKSISGIKSWIDKVKDEINDFVSNPAKYINDHLPSWIKDWFNNLQKAFDNFKEWASDRINDAWKWIQNASTWFNQQLNNAKNIILTWVNPIIQPLSQWIDNFKKNFNEFLKDPIGYITNAVNPLIQQIYDFFSPIVKDIQTRLENAWKTITSLDQAIRYGFTSFLMGILGWFFTSFFRDLAELEYDPETGEVYGTPENPFTYVVIELMKVEKPKPPLE